MTELAKRRRALMGTKEKTGPIYNIINTHVTTTAVQTGVPFLSDTTNYTVLLDIVKNSNPTSGTGRYAKYLLVPGGNFNLGKETAFTSDLRVAWFGEQTNIQGNNGAAAGRKRFAIIHEKGANNLTVTSKYDTGTVNAQIVTGPFTASVNTLQIGAGGDNALFDADIIQCSIYDRILSADEINAFFA